MNIETARMVEHAKYVRCYDAETYRMGDVRRLDAVDALAALPERGSYLDVSTGRGEMLKEAETLGFRPVRGTEIVPDLIDGLMVLRAEVHSLPFVSNCFDTVTMFDVIEHLIPGDDEKACLELARVARQHIVIAANNLPSGHGKNVLHINRRTYDEWDVLFRDWFPGKVIRLGLQRSASVLWRVDL